MSILGSIQVDGSGIFYEDISTRGDNSTRLTKHCEQIAKEFKILKIQAVLPQNDGQKLWLFVDPETSVNLEVVSELLHPFTPDLLVVAEDPWKIIGNGN